LALARVATEVHAIWAPYLDVVVTTGDEGCTACTDEVRVQIIETLSQSADALAWITFEDGEPTREIAVSLPRTRELLRHASVMGRSVDALPRLVVERLFA
jgi:hypothetical protein